MQFIAGHEYSHYLLGHISENNTSEKHILKAIFSSQLDYKPMVVYNTSQQNELDADIASLNLPNYSETEKLLVFEGALLWFACLDLYEAVHNTIFPPFGYQTHPSASERYQNLLDKVKIKKGFNSKYWEKDVPEIIAYYKEYFVEDVSYNVENYEFYGSLYLDKPNTKWRGKELIDRKDYY